MSFFDGRVVRLGRTRRPGVTVDSGVHSAAAIAGSDGQLAMAWLDGDHALVGALDPTTLALVGPPRVALEHAAAVSLASDPAGVELLGLREAACPRRPGCYQPVLGRLAPDLAVSPAALALAYERAGLPVVSPGATVALVEDALMVGGDGEGRRRFPLPAGVGHLVEVQSLAAGPRGLVIGAATAPHGGYAGPRPAFLFLQRPDGVPTCRHEVALPGWAVSRVGLRADEQGQGIDIYMLAYRAEAGRTGVGIHHARLPWP